MTREVGDKLLPKLIPILRDTIVSTKKDLASHERSVRKNATQDVIDAMGTEIADLFRPYMEQIITEAAGTVSPELLAHLKDAASGEHQAKAIGGLLMGPISGALGTLISNEIAPIVYKLVQANPNLDVDPGTAANMAAQGIVTYSNGETAAAQQGFNRDIWSALYQVAQSAPDPTTIWQLLNRGTLAFHEAQRWMHKNGYDPTVIQPIIDLRRQLLSPADLALAVLRQNISHDEGVTIAAENGIDAADFEVLIGNTGEPPGVIDMLTMFRRHIIDEPTLTKGILESRLRNEWIPAIIKYRYSPMSTADAVNAAVQNHLTDTEAASIADQNGLVPGAYDTLRLTAGEPLSLTELLRLWKRGDVSVDIVKQGMRESRLKDKYIDDALKLAIQIPPYFAIEAMLKTGVIPDSLATQWLTDDGYQADAIKAIISASHKAKTVKAKDLSEGMYSTLYLEQAISADDFRAGLKQLGYSQSESDLIIKLDDWRIALAQRNNAIGHVRSAYVGHKISKQDASNRLDALKIPSAMRDKVLADWDLERASAVRLLTPAQVAAAWKLTLITESEAFAYLGKLGYSGSDAILLLEIANKGPLTSAVTAGG
jgi:hypothetical protein